MKQILFFLTTTGQKSELINQGVMFSIHFKDCIILPKKTVMLFPELEKWGRAVGFE